MRRMSSVSQLSGRRVGSHEVRRRPKVEDPGGLSDAVGRQVVPLARRQVSVAVVHPRDDAFGQQVSQDTVDGGVRLAENERQLRRIDERLPAEGIEAAVGLRSPCVERNYAQQTLVRVNCVSMEEVRDPIDSCTGTRYNLFMIRSFRHRGLKRLYERGDPSRIAADQLDRITLTLADLDAAGKPSDLDLPGYRLHPLRGDRRGLWSISISGNWRITFRFEAGDVYDVALVDYHQ